jgi:hypothetical protein
MQCAKASQARPSAILDAAASSAMCQGIAGTTACHFGCRRFICNVRRHRRRDRVPFWMPYAASSTLERDPQFFMHRPPCSVQQNIRPQPLLLTFPCRLLDSSAIVSSSPGLLGRMLATASN